MKTGCPTPPQRTAPTAGRGHVSMFPNLPYGDLTTGWTLQFCPEEGTY